MGAAIHAWYIQFRPLVIFMVLENDEEEDKVK